MKFLKAVETCFKKYADFSGRACRAEFWYFYLFTILGSVCLSLISSQLSLGFSLLTILPTIASAVRRFHDIGKSGWWVLTLIIPILNLFFLFFFMTKRGQEEDNDYGENPLAHELSDPLASLD